MRFMMIVKHVGERQGLPPKELIDAINKLVEQAQKSGSLLGNGGLLPTAQGARVQLANGRLSVTDGPFAETKEVIGGFAQFEVKSKQEAVEAAIEFMELHKKYWPGWEGETEIRQMFDGQDCASESKASTENPELVKQSA